MVYPALLPLMPTPRLPVVDRTHAPADLNGLVRFDERRNLVSARMPSYFNWPLLAEVTWVAQRLRTALTMIPNWACGSAWRQGPILFFVTMDNERNARSKWSQMWYTKIRILQNCNDFLFVLGFLKDNMHIHNSHTRPTTHVYNPLNAELNPICHLLALLEAHHILHVSRVRVKFTDNSQSHHIEYTYNSKHEHRTKRYSCSKLATILTAAPLAL